MTKLPIICLLILLQCTALHSQTAFAVGADVSFLKQLEDSGAVFSDQGQTGDALEILQDHGFNWIRLKLWHSPAEPYNDLPRVRDMAVRAKSMGFKLLLNFHYSDTWADPAHQDIPAAWTALGIDDLVDSLYAYTDHVMSVLDAAGALPDMVQIGNEINCGILWPLGNVCGANNNDQQWDHLSRLVQAGIDAVQQHYNAADSVRIMLHHSEGGDNASVRWFMGNLLPRVEGVDVLGLSYYSKWHGPLAALAANLDDLATRFTQDIIIVETAYPWTMDWSDDQNNIWGSQDLLEGFPATVAGQTGYLDTLRQVVANTPLGKGLGIFYWEPEWISSPALNSAWENATLFNFEGQALPSISALAPLTPVRQVIPEREVVLRVFPNPFNGQTQIEYSLSSAGPAYVDIIDIRGRSVMTYIPGEQRVGVNRISWDGIGEAGHKLPSGVYFVSLRLTQQVVTRKLILLQ